MNPLMMLTGNNNASNIMMQAFGAMMRGESPKTFLKNMANNNPQLQGMNFDNLESTAKNLCDQRNIDMNNLKGQIEEFANSHK